MVGGGFGVLVFVGESGGFMVVMGGGGVVVVVFVECYDCMGGVVD